MAQKGPNTSKSADYTGPKGVSANSKRIKKDKKGSNKNTFRLKEQKKKLQGKASQSVGQEEGEEGMIVSQEENSDLAASSDSDEDAVNPTEKLLIDKYEKYPEYLQLTFKKPDAFFDNLEPFYGANKESIYKIIN